jgi:hypothetical protein
LTRLQIRTEASKLNELHSTISGPHLPCELTGCKDYEIG